MVKLGKTQRLKVANISKIGAYLDGETGNEDDNILLPNNQLPEDVKVDDEIEVFIYRDSEDRIIATRKEPLIECGEIAKLEVKQNTTIGAFLDMGLDKDLLLPFKEQKFNVKVGNKYLVYAYIDKSDRLTATTYVGNHLKCDSPYKKNDIVRGTVYAISKEIGILVAVDDKYKGLIPKNYYFDKIQVGEEIEVRVIRVREDGKLDLSTKEPAYMEMDKDSEMILNKIMRYDGLLPLNDKSKPEDIKDRLHISKAAFKRAVGRLLKQDKIIQTEKGLKLKEE